ncbi:tetraspanin-8-like [Punica granatum]|uniref:Tetraspanin-8-like n=1 Tax=Punica granatum TaxID=22663 RepID=A0A6P8C968_PUNGR|nr:tetraspanin-8-like [Punica granatum]
MPLQLTTKYVCCFLMSHALLISIPNTAAGCCKPSNDCNFTYVSPTVWNKPADGVYTNPDCNSWDNSSNVLCYDCHSCKAGLLDNIKSDWKKVAIVNIVFLIFLIIVYYSIGCCAFRNNRHDNSYGYGGGWKR